MNKHQCQFGLPLNIFSTKSMTPPTRLDNGFSKALSSYSCPLMALRYSWSTYFSSDWKHCQSTDISWTLSPWAEVNFLKQWAAHSQRLASERWRNLIYLPQFFIFMCSVQNSCENIFQINFSLCPVLSYFLPKRF